MRKRMAGVACAFESGSGRGDSSRPLLPYVILLVLACLCPRALRAADAKPEPLSPKVVAELKQLQTAALKSDYAYERAAHLCDNIGPRLSGSPQYAQAAQYVAEQLRREGLEVTLEPVMVPHWVRGLEAAELVEFPGMAPGTTQRLAVTALGGSVATPPEGLTASVVVVRDFDELSALGREGVDGKIVVYDEPFDKRQEEAGFGLETYGNAVAFRSRGASAAARLGGVASLIRSAGGGGLRQPHTGSVTYADTSAMIPAGALAAEDADLIARLARQGPVRLHLLLTPQRLPEVESQNVIADLKGSTHPEQIVIVSAHLDSWDLGSGAVDDADGIGAVMGTAHLVKQLGLKPGRTLRFIAWVNEENGLRGGVTYTARRRDQLADHVAALEVDLGAGHPVGIGYEGDADQADYLRPVSKVLVSQGADLVLPVEDTGVDLIPLASFGVPTFAPVQDARTYFDYHHSAADTFDKIEPEALREMTSLLAVLSYALGNMEAVPPHAAAKPLPRWLQGAMERATAATPER